MASVPVSIASDKTYGPTYHHLPLPPDMWEESAPMNWPPGGRLGLHALAPKVLHKGQAIVQEGHDLGPLLSHMLMNHAPLSLKSSRKTVYSASTVLAEGKPVACVDYTRLMMVCGDPMSQHSGSNGTNPLHTVLVGMTDLDPFPGKLREDLAGDGYAPIEQCRSARRSIARTSTTGAL